MTIQRRPLFLLALFVSLMPLAGQTQPVVDYLVSQVPSDPQADGSNRYSLTDIQTVIGAELYWNVLLRRAVFVDPNSRLTFSVVIDSRLGRVGSQIVEWTVPPTLRRGEIYVSRELLESVFALFPDYTAPGQAESGAEAPDEPPVSDGLPEEPPTAGDSGPIQIKRLLLLTVPAGGAVSDATGSSKAVAKRLIDQLSGALKEGGIEVTSLEWDPEKAAETYLEADALLALRVESASPTMRTAFLYYSVGAARIGEQASGLWPWSRVSESHKQDSRGIAELLYRSYIGEFGETRAVGLRSGPLDVLEGRQFPAVLLNLGIDPGATEEEIQKAAGAIGRSILEMKKS